MQVLGTNRWELDADPQFLILKALEFSEMVTDRGIANSTARGWQRTRS